MIAGLEPITGRHHGSIDGKRMNDVPAAKRGIAMVFQSYALYPHMNVATRTWPSGLKPRKAPKGERSPRNAVQKRRGNPAIEPLSASASPSS